MFSVCSVVNNAGYPVSVAASRLTSRVAWAALPLLVHDLLPRRVMRVPTFDVAGDGEASEQVLTERVNQLDISISIGPRTRGHMVRHDGARAVSARSPAAWSS